MEALKQKRWLRMIPYLAIIIGISVGFVLLFRYLVSYLGIPVERLEELGSAAYLIVFIVTLASNVSILVPVAFHVSIMIAAAQYWDPVLIALVASVAGALGEISAYYAGYLGKRIVLAGNTPGYERLVVWMERHGPWGIFLLSLQPVLPFDVAGLLAGASKLPLWKFLLPCWAGKFPKYLLACYLGEAFLRLLPLPPL